MKPTDVKSADAKSADAKHYFSSIHESRISYIPIDHKIPTLSSIKAPHPLAT